MKSFHRNLIVYLILHFLPLPATDRVQAVIGEGYDTPKFQIQLSGPESHLYSNTIDSYFRRLIPLADPAFNVYEVESEYEVEDDRETEITDHDFGAIACISKVFQDHKSHLHLKVFGQIIILCNLRSKVLRC